jgi:hypothetical protein
LKRSENAKKKKERNIFFCNEKLQKEINKHNVREKHNLCISEFKKYL